MIIISTYVGIVIFIFNYYNYNCKVKIVNPDTLLYFHTQHAGIDYNVKHIKHFINISFSLYFCHTVVLQLRLSERTGVDDTLHILHTLKEYNIMGPTR